MDREDALVLLRSAQRISQESANLLRQILTPNFNGPSVTAAKLNVATSPMTTVSGGVSPEEEVVDVHAIAEMRDQMLRLESVVTLRDEVEEQCELLKEQKEQLLQKSLDATQLLEDARNTNENAEFVVESLKRSYEEALTDANNALITQTTASNRQIQRLEKLLIQQQIQLAGLGAPYSPLVSLRSKSREAVEGSLLSLGGRTTLPIDRRRLAYLENLAGIPNEDDAHQYANDISTRDTYLFQLEDEILNLRIHLASEIELRRRLEKEREAVHDQLKRAETYLDGVEIPDEMEFINVTSSLSIEDQNLSLGKVADKLKMINSLNMLRRHGMERISQLESCLANLNGRQHRYFFR